MHKPDCVSRRISYHNFLSSWWFRYGAALLCGLLNFGIARGSHALNLPLYADSIATIGTAVYLGIFPGILCALMTNSLLALFSAVPFPFIICNIATALIAGYMGRRIQRSDDSIRNYLWMGFWISLANGIIGSIISLILFDGRIEGREIDTLTMGFYISLDSYEAAVFFAGIITNLLDKMVSVFIIFFLRPILERRPLIDK